MEIKKRVMYTIVFNEEKDIEALKRISELVHTIPEALATSYGQTVADDTLVFLEELKRGLRKND